MRALPGFSFAVLAAALAIGCKEEPPAPATTPSATAPKPSVAAPTPTPTPTPTASVAEKKPSRACPAGSTGDGTFSKPCEAKGTAREMEVTWTGKTDDKGPSFRVVSKSKYDILFGNLSAYFYDKAGKQLEVKDASGKAKPKQACSGKIFDGPMKAGEKAVITFSCVKKEHVPEGTAHIEAEMQMVGYLDEAGTGSDTYWRNNDLVPDARPKGGIKK